MTTRRAAATGALVGLALAVVAIIVFTIVGGPRAAVFHSGDTLSPGEYRTVFNDRFELTNYCTQALGASGGGPRPPQAATARARQAVDGLIAIAHRHPRAYVSEIGTMKVVLNGAAKDVEEPACLPDEAARLRAEAARVPG